MTVLFTTWYIIDRIATLIAGSELSFDFIPTAVVLYSILCIRLATASKTSAVSIACNMKSAEVEHMGPQTCRVGLRPKVQNREPI
mgnify:CR=1 FL=1